jgi:hypothetical protein
LVPPARRLEVAERTGARVQPVLRLAVHQDIQVAVRLFDDAEDTDGVGLIGLADVQPQRQIAEPAESDIREPPPIPVATPTVDVHVDAQREVVVRRSKTLRCVGAGVQQADRVTQRGQQCPERPVELITKPAAPSPHHLVDQRLLVEHDAFAQVDAEVLERHRAQVAELQLPQRGRVGPRRAGRADPRQVGVQLRAVHPRTPRS